MGPPRFHPASLFFPFFFLFSFFRRFTSFPAAPAASSTCSLPARVIFLLALSSLGSAVNTAGWTVRPSNNSGDLSWTGGLRFLLNSSQVHLPTSVRLAPLTQALVDLNQAELAVSQPCRRLTMSRLMESSNIWCPGLCWMWMPPTLCH